MAVIEALIQKEENGTLSFGNYDLETKTKLSDFEYNGDIYKIKTFKENLYFTVRECLNDVETSYNNLSLL